MARVVVSEFQLKSLDRAARFAGEVFGSDDAAGRDTQAEQSINRSATLWTAGAVIALCGMLVLIQ